MVLTVFSIKVILIGLNIVQTMKVEVQETPREEMVVRMKNMKNY